MRTVNIRILHTSDIHGCLFPFDFLHGKEATGSLSRAYNYIKSRRKTFGRNLLLIDSGDILQGQPTFYLSNFINTEKPNLAASVYNYAVFLLSVVIRRDVKNLHLAEEEVPVWEIPHLEDHPEVIFQVILQYIQRILVAVLS